jgi:hypothetical protein
MEICALQKAYLDCLPVSIVIPEMCMILCDSCSLLFTAVASKQLDVQITLMCGSVAT